MFYSLGAHVHTYEGGFLIFSWVGSPLPNPQGGLEYKKEMYIQPDTGR